MSPAIFPQANTQFGPPDTMDESQCGTIPAHMREIIGGTLDGATIVVVAWLPSEIEIEQLIKGHPVYVTMVGVVAPHRLTTTFEEAIA